MTLEHAVTSHHTVWVSDGSGNSIPERYAVDGDRIVCFGDRGLSTLADGARVWASVHEIAGGPLLTSFSAVVHELAPEAVPAGALVELLDHVSLGGTPAEVTTHLEAHRRRRILELTP